MSTAKAAPLHITPLGGVGRFGGNAMLFDTGQCAVVVDCGVRFLNHDEAPGFDFGLCDISAIAAVRERLAGYLLTHGHEDHVGALPYAFDVAPAPIFASPFTKFRVQKAFERAGAHLPDDVRKLEPGSKFQLDAFEVQCLAVSHSIPGALALALRTEAGCVVHSGDFRVDVDPLVGPATDLPGLRALGEQGVDLLVADSTAVSAPGSNAGERSVVNPLIDAVKDAPGQVLVTTFGSHVQRVAACAEVCRATGRRLMLVGRSLEMAVRAARDLSLSSLEHLQLEDVLLNAAKGQGVPPHRALIVASGCQGERQGSWAQIARGEHRRIRLGAGDRLIYSARVIPGNERQVAAIFDLFANLGVEIVDGSGGRHVSGHGSAGDLEALLKATSPRAFAAIHGGGRQLAAHRTLAATAGLAPQQIFPLVDGQRLTLDQGVVRSAQLGPDHKQVGRISVPRRPPDKARASSEVSIPGGCDLSSGESNAGRRDGSAARTVDLFMVGPLGPRQECWTQGRHVVSDGGPIADQRRRMGKVGLLLIRQDGDGPPHVDGRALAPALHDDRARRFIAKHAAELLDQNLSESERTARLTSAIRRRFGLVPEIWWVSTCAPPPTTEH